MVDVTLEFITTRIFSDVDSAGTANPCLFPRVLKSVDAYANPACATRTHTYYHMHADKYTGQIFRELTTHGWRLKIIWISSPAMWNEDDDRFFAGPLTKVNSTDPRLTGWMGRKRRPQWPSIFFPSSRSLESRSRKAEARYPLGGVPLMMAMASIYGVPIPARSWDWYPETETKNNGILLLHPTIPPVPSGFPIYPECIIEWKVSRSVRLDNKDL